MRKILVLAAIFMFMLPFNVHAMTNPPWSTFVLNGHYSEDITLSGRSKKSADLIVEITKSGSDREGEYRYSSDNGNTWSEIKVIKTGTDVGLVSTDPSASDLGTKIRFSSGIDFIKGDRYLIKTPISYEVTENSNAGTAQIQVSSEDVIYNDSYRLVFKITKSGALGEGQFSYSSDGGSSFSESIEIPENGVVRLFNNRITVRFYDGEGNFLVGDEYRCEIKGDMSKRDYTPYFVFMAGAVFILIMMVFRKYSGMRDKPQNYVICEYKQIEERRNRNLPRRRDV